MAWEVLLTMDLAISPLQITQEQVQAFSSDAAKFNEKFKAEGPSCVGTDLDKGETALRCFLDNAGYYCVRVN